MKQKHKNKGISTSVVRFIAFMFIVTLGYQGVRLVKISRNLDRQIEETQKELATEHKRLEELKVEYEGIDSLRTIEKVAREKLGLVMDDEIVFREKY